MRLLTLAFPSASAFLIAHEDGVLTVSTRTDAALGEEVLAEISFPGLPNRALVRGAIDGLLVEEEGLRVRLSDEDRTTLDFMLSIARGELKLSTHREHRRFPASLSVEYTCEGDAAARKATIDDLGAGGTFVRTQSPPAAGTRVDLSIGVPGGAPVHASGVTAWVKTGPGDAAGFGVDFDPLEGDDGRRLRALLRRASETAEVDLDQKG